MNNLPSWVIPVLIVVAVLVVIAIIVGIAAAARASKKKKERQQEADRARAAELRQQAERDRLKVEEQELSAREAQLQADRTRHQARQEEQAAAQRTEEARASRSQVDERLAEADRLDPAGAHDRQADHRGAAAGAARTDAETSAQSRRDHGSAPDHRDGLDNRNEDGTAVHGDQHQDARANAQTHSRYDGRENLYADTQHDRNEGQYRNALGRDDERREPHLGADQYDDRRDGRPTATSTGAVAGIESDGSENGSTVAADGHGRHAARHDEHGYEQPAQGYAQADQHGYDQRAATQGYPQDAHVTREAHDGQQGYPQDAQQDYERQNQEGFDQHEQQVDEFGQPYQPGLNEQQGQSQWRPQDGDTPCH